MTLPHQPGSAEQPAMFAWSSTAASLAVQVSARPRITGSMLHRSATTSASVLVHDCRTCCTCFTKLTGAYNGRTFQSRLRLYSK